MRAELFQDAVESSTKVFGRKDVRVIFAGSQAHTNGDTVVIPSLPSMADISEEEAMIIRGYRDHESMHVRITDTSPEAMQKLTDAANKDPFLLDLYQYTEDLRIEHAGIQEYFGMKNTFGAMEVACSTPIWEQIEQVCKTTGATLDQVINGMDPKVALKVTMQAESRRTLGMNPGHYGAIADAIKRANPSLHAFARQWAQRWVELPTGYDEQAGTLNAEVGKAGTWESFRLADKIYEAFGQFVRQPQPPAGEGEEEGEEGEGPVGPGRPRKPKPGDKKGKGKGNPEGGKGDGEDGDTEPGEEGSGDAEGKGKGKGKSTNGKEGGDGEGDDEGEADGDAEKESSSGDEPHGEGDDGADGGDGEQGDADDEGADGADQETGDGAGDDDDSGEDGEDGDGEADDEFDTDLTGANSPSGDDNPTGANSGAKYDFNMAKQGDALQRALDKINKRANDDKPSGGGGVGAPWRRVSNEAYSRIGVSAQYGQPQVAKALFNSIKDKSAMIRRILELQLQARMDRVWDHGYKSGRFTASRLVEAVQGRPNVFSRRHDGKDMDTYLRISIDGSGSMGGGLHSKMGQAARLSLALCEALERTGCEIEVEVWDDTWLFYNGETEDFVRQHWGADTKIYRMPRVSSEEYRRLTYADQQTQNPMLRATSTGVLNVRVVKDRKERVRDPKVQAKFGWLANAACGGTPMVDAVTRALMETLTERHGKRILMVMTDGASCGYGNDPAANNLRQMAELHKLADKHDIHLLGVGIGHNVSRHFRDSLYVNADTMYEQVIRRIAKYLAEEHKKVWRAAA